MIDFTKLWCIVSCLTMLSKLYIRKMILRNVGVTNNIKPTISELRFQDCTFDNGEFMSLGDNISSLGFEHCLGMKNFVVKRGMFVHVRNFIISRCHNLESIAIEEGNFQKVETQNFMDGLTHVKELVLGPLACSLCSALTIQGMEALEYIKLERKACKAGVTLLIGSCPELRSIEMDQECFMSATSIGILKAPKLETISGKGGNFMKIDHVILRDTPLLTFMFKVRVRKSPKLELENVGPDTEMSVLKWLGKM